jgi:phage terminase large subunit GpA-like protein
MVVYSKGGVPTVMWKRIRQRNEQLDCMVYAYAIYQSLGLQYMSVQLPDNIKKWSSEPDTTLVVDATTDVAPPQAAPSGFTKRTVMKMPRKNGGLIQRNWLG